LFTIIVIVIRCDATPEEEKKKSDDLMKELDKPHADINENLMTQLKRIAGELRGHYNQRPNKEYTQWVVATPLNIKRVGKGDLILKKQDVIVDKHIYSNFKKNYKDSREKNIDRRKYCNSKCIKNIEKLSTKINRNKILGDGNVIHTEIQMLYREKADNILQDKANKNKVILVYSKYIPCSQNQNHQGGTFVECAGELANYVANKNFNGNKLIVFYETTHVSNNNNAGVTVSSVVGVSQLYMEMSGIVAFKYKPWTRDQPIIKLQRDPQLIKKATYFRRYPKFIQLGRPLIKEAFKATVTQMFIDCLARNNFVTNNVNDEAVLEVQFITAKHFLSMIPVAKKNKIDKLFEMANKGKDKTNKHDAFIKGCYQFAKEMSRDPNKKTLIVLKKAGDYLNFQGYSTELDQSKKTDEFFVNSQRDACEPFLAALKKFFKRKQNSKPVCLKKARSSTKRNGRPYK